MLHQMERPEGIKKNKKRLGKGQGTGQGHQAGKGHKGHKARSGGKTPRYFEGGQMPIQRRLPKRGFTNIFRKEYRIVNLYQLLELDMETIDINIMEEKAIIRSQGRYKNMPVKILADGAQEFSKKLEIKANAFSQTAKEIIEKNGGKAEVV
ncbi:MAG: 50S ribosomal protein L15 [Candidatus Cloacimonetes bacterium]|nr:50S ribosomal protein L15 [Candidatus Cloacimonadota bacterium]MDD4155407.1 50S ribosomal protein L15 [Candidatus Cloacimonadota bacterium]